MKLKLQGAVPLCVTQFAKWNKLKQRLCEAPVKKGGGENLSVSGHNSRASGVQFQSVLRLNTLNSLPAWAETI